MTPRVLVVAFLLLVFCFCGAAIADETVQAPLGFRWGMSVAEVREMGLGTVRDVGNNIYMVSRTPKQIPNTSYVLLLFSESKLVKVGWYSPTAAKGDVVENMKVLFEDYNRLKGSLVEKYGNPEFGGEVFDRNRPKKEARHFLACLKEGQKCGIWRSAWKINGVHISLEITPVTVADDQGYVEMSYTVIPTNGSKEVADVKDAL